MSGKNGEVKKAKKLNRQRAVIVISEHEDPTKFNATIQFEPSIKRFSSAQRAEHPVIMAAWAAWKQLKNDKRGLIIITDA